MSNVRDLGMMEPTLRGVLAQIAAALAFLAGGAVFVLALIVVFA